MRRFRGRCEGCCGCFCVDMFLFIPSILFFGEYNVMFLVCVYNIVVSSPSLVSALDSPWEYSHFFTGEQKHLVEGKASSFKSEVLKKLTGLVHGMRLSCRLRLTCTSR